MLDSVRSMERAPYSPRNRSPRVSIQPQLSPFGSAEGAGLLRRRSFAEQSGRRLAWARARSLLFLFRLALLGAAALGGLISLRNSLLLPLLPAYVRQLDMTLKTADVSTRHVAEVHHPPGGTSTAQQQEAAHSDAVSKGLQEDGEGASLASSALHPSLRSDASQALQGLQGEHRDVPGKAKDGGSAGGPDPQLGEGAPGKSGLRYLTAAPEASPLSQKPPAQGSLAFQSMQDVAASGWKESQQALGAGPVEERQPGVKEGSSYNLGNPSRVPSVGEGGEAKEEAVAASPGAEGLPALEESSSLAGDSPPEIPAPGGLPEVLTAGTPREHSGKGALAVYVYELPARFTWGTLTGGGAARERVVAVRGPGLFPTDDLGEAQQQGWGRLQAPRDNASVLLPAPPAERLVAQHALGYYLLLSLLTGLPSVRRVARPEEAELLLVPFFASVCYLRFCGHNPHRRDQDEEMQEQLWEWLQQHPVWRRWPPSRHLLAAHHPHSLEHMLPLVPEAHLLVADMWRPTHAAGAATNVQKDVVAPYRSFVEPFCNDRAGWAGRSTLLFFRGGTKRKRRGGIRSLLQGVLQGEPDVVYEEAESWRAGAVEATTQGMRTAKFCLSPAGDTPSSCRLFDAIVSHCVPVIVSDRLELPFEDVLDYSRFTVLVPEARAGEPGLLLGRLRAITQRQWEALWHRLLEVEQHFVYSHPAPGGGAADMIWQALARRVREGGLDTTYRSRRLSFQRNKRTQIFGE